jgi:hypothetical protein
MSGQINKKNNEAKPMTIREKNEAAKLAEQKRKVNIFLSRRAGEESRTGYQTSSSSFAGGAVKTRTRVSMVGRDNEGGAGKAQRRVGFAGREGDSSRVGFAKKNEYGSATSRPGSSPAVKPMGFR